MNSKLNMYNQALKKGAYTRHVIKRGERWVVKKVSATKVSAIRDTQKQAISTAKRMAEKKSSRIVIHNAQGKIREII